MKVHELVDILTDETHSQTTGLPRELNLIVDGVTYYDVNLEITGVEFGAFKASLDLEVVE